MRRTNGKLDAKLHWLVTDSRTWIEQRERAAMCNTNIVSNGQAEPYSAPRITMLLERLEQPVHNRVRDAVAAVHHVDPTCAGHVTAVDCEDYRGAWSGVPDSICNEIAEHLVEAGSVRRHAHCAM